MALSDAERAERKRAANRAYMRRYRAKPECREKRLAKDRAWYAQHKDVRLASNKRWRAANSGKWRAYSRKARTGFTQEMWDERFAAQDGLCAICHKRPPTDADHNHTTLQPRGLLCRRCNLAVGFLEDPEYSLAIVGYLHEWAARANN